MKYNKLQDIFEELEGHGKVVFTLNDASKMMNKPKSYTSKLLSSNKRVSRIERGKYFINTGKGIDLYEIASQIVFPSYVSLFAAFQYHMITDQIVTTFSVISLKRHRPITFGDNKIEFRNVQKDKFFGYTREKNIYIATIEKAIVDSLYLNLPSFSYVKESFSTAIGRQIINIEKLVEFTNRMNSGIVTKKMNILLSKENIRVSKSGVEKR